MDDILAGVTLFASILAVPLMVACLALNAVLFMTGLL